MEDPISTTQKLEGKLLEYYGKKIKIQKGKTKRGSLVYCGSMQLEEALRKENLQSINLSVKVKEVAFLLRDEIMKLLLYLMIYVSKIYSMEKLKCLI